MQKLNQSYIKSVVKKALDEDLKPRGDITTNLIKFKNKKAKAQIVAKQDGIIAGLTFCKTAFKLVGKETIFISKVKDGAKVKKNKVIAEIKAKTKTILIAERTALNFLNHASGIATLTNEFVKKASKTKICCTRKTTPNLRTLEKYSVKKGGGHAGHNGLKSIDENIGTDYFRIRIGISHPGEKEKVTGHVLGDLSKEDAETLQKILTSIAENISTLIEGDEKKFQKNILQFKK